MPDYRIRTADIFGCLLFVGIAIATVTNSTMGQPPQSSIPAGRPVPGSQPGYQPGYQQGYGSGPQIGVQVRPGLQLKINFGGRAYADRLANELVTQANNICVQMDRDFRENRNYRETYRAMYGVLLDAKKIRDSVTRGIHRGVRRDHDEIAMALHSIDRQFHSIDAEMRTWRSDSRRNNRQDKAELASVVDEFEETLHQMMEDYGVRTQRNVGPGAGRGQGQAPFPGQGQGQGPGAQGRPSPPNQSPQPPAPPRDRR